MREDFLVWCLERLKAIVETLKSSDSRTILFSDGTVESPNEWQAALEERKAGLLTIILALVRS
jgi:hypothetical protein